MSVPVRSKKMAAFCGFRKAGFAAGHIMRKMVRIGPMASDKFTLDRRKLIAGLGAATLDPGAAGTRLGARRVHRWRCRPKPTVWCSRPGGAATPVWSLAGPDLSFKRGETLDVTFDNGLPVPAALDWRGSTAFRPPSR